MTMYYLCTSSFSFSLPRRNPDPGPLNRLFPPPSPPRHWVPFLFHCEKTFSPSFPRRFFASNCAFLLYEYFGQGKPHHYSAAKIERGRQELKNLRKKKCYFRVAHKHIRHEVCHQKNKRGSTLTPSPLENFLGGDKLTWV